MICKYCKTETYRWDKMVRGYVCRCGKLVRGTNGTIFYLGEEMEIKCGHCQSTDIRIKAKHYICKKCSYYVIKDNYTSDSTWYYGSTYACVKHDKSLEQTNKYGTVRENKIGKGAYELISPIGLKELALVYEESAEHHDARNWEQGLKIGGLLQSAIRHIYQRIEGKTDERHLGQACWNLFCAIHFLEMIDRGLAPKELNDLPCYIPKEKT